MSSYATIRRYGEYGEQTRGFIKALSAIQNYEEALEEFETYVELGWRKCLEEIEKMQPTLWDKINNKSMREKFLEGNLEAISFKHLDKMVQNKSYKGRLDTWKQLERDVGVDMADWWTRYSHLRNLIRVGLEIHVDAPMAKFINVWNNRCSCFR